MFFRLPRTVVLVLAMLGASGAASDGLHAQTFQCTEAVAGQLSEQANVACECRFFHASAMAGTPAGYRWDCGILRPRVRLPVFTTFHGYYPHGYYPFFPYQPFVNVLPQIQSD